MSTRGNSRGRRQGPAASLLAKPEPAAKPTDSPSPEPVGDPVATSTLDAHKAAQIEYREWMAKMSQQSPAEAAEEASPETEVVEEPIPLPTAEERAERSHQEAVGHYLTCLIEMPDSEPRYVVGTRPPRPRFGDLLLEIGDVVPGAANWPRLDSWVRSGIVVPDTQLRRAG